MNFHYYKILTFFSCFLWLAQYDNLFLDNLFMHSLYTLTYFHKCLNISSVMLKYTGIFWATFSQLKISRTGWICWTLRLRLLWCSVPNGAMHFCDNLTKPLPNLIKEKKPYFLTELLIKTTLFHCQIKLSYKHWLVDREGCTECPRRRTASPN